MRKSRLYLGILVMFGATMSIVQAMQPYGSQAMQQPYHPGMQQPMSRDQHKDQIKQQQKIIFFRNNPHATKDAWGTYWKNYKKAHNLD